MIEVLNLSAFYGTKCIFKNISFSLSSGTFTALCGKNGAGKSTLLNLMSGIVPAGLKYEGDVLMDGISVFNMKRKDIARKISFLIQNENPVWNMSVRQFIETGLYSAGSLPKNQSELLVNEALDKIGILDFADKKIFNISGGEFQKCRLARCMVQKTPYMFFDEHSEGLDLPFQQEFLGCIKNLGKTILFSIHDINTAAAFAENFILIFDEEIICGGTQDIFTESVLSKAFSSGTKIYMHPVLKIPQVLFVEENQGNH